MRKRYPAISDHGLIGDLQTAALVTSDGTVDWFCCPRFDSPSVFASLLDHDRGGYFRIGPDHDDYVSRQLYLPDTAILITRFMSDEGVGEVLDFMPVAERETACHRLVRIVRTVRGRMRFTVEAQPRFDYGRRDHELELSPEGAVFHAGGDLGLTLHLTGSAVPERADRGVRLAVELRAGEVDGVVMESGGVAARHVAIAELWALYEETIRFWRAWLGRSSYTGRWREAVSRSAMALKLMTYAPTGAIVAAPTAGLPEQVGAERNWDYRYTWIRDASFSIRALLGLGYTHEVGRYAAWLRDRVEEKAGHASGPLKIMYRVDGSSDLTEETLDHFEGYRGSRPVRVGNGAADQLQLDIYGELLDAAYVADSHGLQPAHVGWTRLLQGLEWLCENWDQAEEGIWETRGGRQDFTYGRLMSWVAFDRAIRIARHSGRPTDHQRLQAERDRIYWQIMERGWNPQRRAFVQHYGSDVLDASLLLMPMMGFVSPQDPQWLSTLEAMDRELVSDSLVYRYNPSASPDGLRGSEGTFSLCTFWYVDALARSGRLEDARITFEKMLTYASPLGLYAEEIGLTGEQLGNFPQAFSHLALINAAVGLNRHLDEAAKRGGLVP
ncbi:glycoside hydrolase family 15 protein [Thermoactinospora rubra]|uniref:glycoside hydrolase family 15 protein n=1 Tax=Thermoactinospora rubra TaxID=1088767 RepID=UPI000A111181|nr:glycoside hydrolase family 15 protein [Thermoactinospora rubra]